MHPVDRHAPAHPVVAHVINVGADLTQRASTQHAPQESFVDALLKKQAAHTSAAAENLMRTQAKEADAEAERREAEWVYANPEAAKTRAEARATVVRERAEAAAASAKYYRELRNDVMTYKGALLSGVVIALTAFVIKCM